MADLADHEERIEHLEKIIAQTGLGYGQYFPGSLRVCRADKDGDGDFDPYISSSWDGDSFSTGTGTIDWNADFGVPDSARMVFLYIALRDSSATDGAGRLDLKAKSTTTRGSINVHSRPSNKLEDADGWGAVAQDGTSYYSIVASGTNTCDIWIRVVAYAR